MIQEQVEAVASQQSASKAFRKRDTAICLSVKEILAGSFVRGSAEGEPSFVESEGEKFSRVKLVGTIVQRSEDENGVTLLLLDGGTSIAVRAYTQEGNSMLQALNKGDDAQIIGRIREREERFVSAEIATALHDLNWETVHRLSTAIRV